jgi:MFS family permease
LFIEAGRIVHPVDIPQLGFPLLGQMHFALGMLLGLGDGPAALFHFGYGLMAVAVTVSLAQRAFDRTAAWFAGALLLSVPTLLTLMSWPYVDVTLLFYATAAFYAFLRWRQAYLAGARETGWLFLLGIFCGFGGSVKYTAVVVPISLALSVAWITRHGGLWPLVRRLALIGFIALALVIPYLVENWLTTGNPVYPFFFDNGIFWDSWRAWWYDRPGTGLLTTAPWRLPFVPLELTVLGTEGTTFYEATVGPLPFVWRTLTREEKALSGHMLLFLALNYLLWLNGVARTALLLRARFLFFVFGVTAALGGVALARLPALRRPQIDVNWLVQAVVVLSLALILFGKTLEFLKINPLPAVTGVESADSYRRRRLGAYEAAMDAVNQLPAGSKVEFLWEPRSYGCRVECWPDLNLDRYLHYTHFYGFDAAELANFWRREGYTHVLLHQAGLDFVWENRRELDQITAADLAILDELEEKHLVPVHQWEGGYTLYEIAH